MFDWLKKKQKFGEDYLKCPRCGIDMEKLNKNGVIIDICRKCNGMWLDDKEIDNLIKQVKGAQNNRKNFKQQKIITKR